MIKNLVITLLSIALIATFILLRSKEVQEFVAVTYAPDYPDEKVVTDLVNEWKFATDGYRYEESVLTCAFAELRVQETVNDWSHEGFESKTEELFDTTRVTHFGENLSRNFTDEVLMLYGWLESPLHKENLDEDDFTKSCIKCEKEFCVHIFSD